MDQKRIEFRGIRSPTLLHVIEPHPFVDVEHPVGFAHRGGTERAGENTFEAFEHAAELGFRYLETDVHLSADGAIVAFHDESLDRVTDRAGRIDAVEWSEIAQATVVGGGRIPLLGELLAAFPDHRFNIDAKSDAVVDPLVAALVEADALDRVCLASFSARRLRDLRARLGPAACTALSRSEIARVRAGTVRGVAGQCVQVPVRSRGIRLVTRRVVDRAHGAGLAVHVWTIDDPEEMHELLDLGVDGIMTDRPTVLRDVLRQRGDWRG